AGPQFEFPYRFVWRQRWGGRDELLWNADHLSLTFPVAALGGCKALWKKRREREAHGDLDIGSAADHRQLANLDGTRARAILASLKENLFGMVEPRGFEPLTPTMPLWCSTN